MNGDGCAEVIQQYAIGDWLGVNIYDRHDGDLAKLQGPLEMGQGVAALKWTIGDFQGIGRASVIQQWGDPSGDTKSVRTILYGENVPSPPSGNS